jgi:glutamate 5-kinase
VVKIGSALLTNDGQGLDESAINDWVAQLSALQARGIELVLVSSGAVAAGVRRLGWQRRPDSLHELQAAAAVGQTSLVRAYEQAFERDNICTAQVLLDHDDLSNRQRYLNARSTLKTLIKHKVVAIVNENDTVVTDEIRFGDNDTLAALVANLVEADVLIILTDQNGMYTADPRTDSSAELISEAQADDASLDSKAGDGGELGRGGMTTKVKAARLASRSGADTIIVGGRIDNVLGRLFSGESLGTLLTAQQKPEAARKRWLAGQLQMRGQLTLDSGAVRVLKKQGKSLLPVGVVEVSGRFKRGDMVACVDVDGSEIARGLSNYDFLDAEKIIGRSSADFEGLLGYIGDEEIIHRDNLVVL